MLLGKMTQPVVLSTVPSPDLRRIALLCGVWNQVTMEPEREKPVRESQFCEPFESAQDRRYAVGSEGWEYGEGI